jgi:hypothetical protein
MAIAVAVQPIRTETPLPDHLRLTAQAQKGHLPSQAHLFKQPVIAVTIPVAIPETSSHRHGRLMDRRHPDHKHRSETDGLGQQAIESVEKGLRFQLRTTIGATDPGGVVETDAQQNPLGDLPPQLAPDLKLVDQTVGQTFKAVTAHAEVVENRPIVATHPVAAEAFNPATALGVAPAVDATVPHGKQLARHPQG